MGGTRLNMAALADMLQELTNIPQSDRQRTKQTALLINALQTLAECKAPLLSQLSTLVDKATTLPPQPARIDKTKANRFGPMMCAAANTAVKLMGSASFAEEEDQAGVTFVLHHEYFRKLLESIDAALRSASTPELKQAESSMRNLRAVYAANEEQKQEAAMRTLSAGSAAVLNDQMAVLSTQMANQQIQTEI